MTGRQFDLKLLISGEDRGTTALLDKTRAGLESIQASTQKIAAISGLNLAFDVMASAAGRAADALSSLPRAGIEFQASMETSALGMAGILSSMTRVEGKALALPQALAIASQYILKLNDDALRTAASSQELVGTFQALLGPGLAANMTLEQIRQLTVTGTNAVKSLGLPARQIVQEMRDMVAGGITPASSTLATALGLKDEDIKHARTSAEGLFSFLMQRLEGFTASSERFGDTFQGRIEQLKETATRAAAEGFDPLFQAIKDGAKEAGAAFGSIDPTGKVVINPEMVGQMKAIAESIANIGREAGAGASWLYQHREAVLSVAEAYVGLRVAILAGQTAQGAMDAVMARMTAMSQFLSGETVAARIAAAQAAMADAVATEREAAAQLHAAQTAALGVTETRAATVAKLQLAAASEASAIAERTLAAAQAQTTLAGRSASAMMMAMGGPIGAIVTVLGLAATAWMVFGNKASDAVQKANDKIEAGLKLAQRYKDEAKFGTGDPGTFRQSLEEVQSRISILSQSKSDAARREIEELRKKEATLTDNLAKADSSAPAGNLTNRFTSGEFAKQVKEFRSNAEKMKEELADLDRNYKAEVSAAAGNEKELAKLQDEYGKTKANIRKKYSENASAAELSAVKAEAEGTAKLVREHLTQAQAAYDAAYAKRLMSIKDYYTARRTIEEAALDQELAAKRTELAEAEKGGGSAKNGKDAAAARARVAQLEGEIAVLSAKRDGVGPKADREAADAAQEWADKLVNLRAELRSLSGETANADDVAKQVEMKYREALRQATSEGNQGDIDLVKKIINLETVKEQLAALQQLYDQALTQMRATEQSLEARRVTGALTETESREKLLELHKQTAAEISGLIPKMQALAAASGNPELIANVQRMNAEFVGLRDELSANEKTLRDGFQSASATMFSDFIKGTDTAGKAFAKFGESVMNKIIDIYATAMANRVTDGLFGNGGMLSTAFSFFSGSSGTPAPDIQAHAEGGPIVGPGSGTSDSVMMLGSHGEYVIKASAVRRFGRGFFDVLNRGFMPTIRAYATGGLIGEEAAAATGGTRPAGAAGGIRVEVVNQGTPQRADSVTTSFDPAGMVIKILMQDLKIGGPASQAMASTFGLKR